jgi:hypothetical protein
MNVGIGIVAAQFLSWEYMIRIFGIVSLQCAFKNCVILHAIYVFFYLFLPSNIKQ